MTFLLLLACATTGANSAGAAPPVPPEMLAMQGPAPAPPPGSLYSDVGGRALIGMDNNARRVGDLVTVLVNEADSTSMSANTALSRSSSTNAEISALFGLRRAILDANPDMGGTLGLGGSSGSETTGDGETSRQGSLSAVLTCK
ncbi:MAG: flagellar basal body L-ring protein FlgH, partial [Deltaproteobacteria bacterium]|nr:flagellar basal body L-ring protein FlgH [Deltaproteobacteria bacterium]